MRIPVVPADAPTTGARVLLVDDDRRVRATFATLLRPTAGVASVVEAADGAEAVELGGARHLDIAVLDMNMPRWTASTPPSGCVRSSRRCRSRFTAQIRSCSVGTRPGPTCRCSTSSTLTG
jgi:CheY-like chemotaxis protein